MNGVVSYAILASATLSSVLFLIFRLRLFKDEDVGGRKLFLAGGIALTVAIIWQSVAESTTYAKWFLTSVYPVLSAAQWLVGGIGALMLLIGLALYADYWQSRREEIEARELEESVLFNLQRDARQPFHLMELLDRSVKEIVSSMAETSGAVFLINRSSRQFVLTASAGLTKHEVALLEHYPFHRNIVRQSIEVGEPLVTGVFELVDRDGTSHDSRFNSSLVLPLISGRQEIGGVVLLSEQKSHFGQHEIRYLTPVTQWLAEKINSARLVRELTLARKEVQKSGLERSDLDARLAAVASSFTSTETATAFCRALVGIAASQSVHLAGLHQGQFNIYDGSEPLTDLTESYRTALFDAIDRDKPLIINQEAVTSEGRSYIARSTMVYPLPDELTQEALVFIKDSGPFKVGQAELRLMESFAHLGRLALRLGRYHQRDVTRRRGLEKILQLLRSEGWSRFADDPEFFISHLAGVLPTTARALMFVRQNDSSLTVQGTHNVDLETARRFQLLPGEFVVGEAALSGSVQILSGRKEISAAAQTLERHNREAFFAMLGEEGSPNLLTACPVSDAEGVVGVALVLLYDAAEQERGEWQRLLTLAAGLYSVNLTIGELRLRRPDEVAPGESAGVSGEVCNRLNNHLSAVIGTAQLAASADGIPGSIRIQLDRIVTEAEKAASEMRVLQESTSQKRPPDISETGPAPDFNSAIRAVLASSRISEGLYMAGGRPQEIVTDLGAVDEIVLADNSIQSLFEETIGRFSTTVGAEDIITVSTYSDQRFVYLDISRHRRNFPPVQRVAGFGEYRPCTEVARQRPADTYLRHLSDTECQYSFDRMANQPSYLSFKIPRKIFSGHASKARPTRVLVIDDQQVILDLVTAMGQASGYEVRSASSGEAGLELAMTGDFDIVLTDMSMPGMSGLDVARAIKKRQLNLPTVLLTGWKVSIEESQLAAAGISKVLYKPFRIEQLVQLISSLAIHRNQLDLS